MDNDTLRILEHACRERAAELLRKADRHKSRRLAQDAAALMREAESVIRKAKGG